MKKILIYGLFCLVAGISTVAVTATASAAVTAETAFIFNTLSFLVHGFLVMWMAAGFCMLEAGLVRSKNTAMVSIRHSTSENNLKNHSSRNLHSSPLGRRRISRRVAKIN